MSTVVRISESSELPLLTGTIEIDTSKGGITLFLKAAIAHGPSETLTVTKVSSDANMISLFAENVLINGAEIVIFGLPMYAKVKKGKVRTLVLKSDGIQWKIVHEE